MSTPIGIIGGTALADIGGLASARSTHPKTAYGRPSGPVRSGRLAGLDVCFVMRHGPGHAIAPHRINYRANVRALADAGCERVISVAAVGGIAPGATPGAMVVPDQIIDYTWGRAHTFDDDKHGSPLHIDFTKPYDRHVSRALIDASDNIGCRPLAPAVHGVTQGPRLETAAEVDRLERDGCAIVGMTGMPEAALAREAGLALGCLAIVVNHAAGRGDGQAIHDELEATLAAAIDNAERVLTRAVALL